MNAPSTITYCQVNGSHKHPDPPAQLCAHCEDQLTRWLKEIPNHYALLPTFLQHGTTDSNPDSKATKRSEAAAPMRLEIIDLLDTRLGRKWQGLAVTDDRRGTLGTLLAITGEIHDGRNLTGEQPTNVTAACNYITRHMLWLITQEWVGDTYSELRKLHRSLSDAVGIYRPKPVGKCHVIPEDAEEPCGGPLMASPYGGVRCPRCESTWDATHLRQLGLAITAQEPA
jgi:hypothetical protein